MIQIKKQSLYDLKKNQYNPTKENILLYNVFTEELKEIDSFAILEQLIKMYPFKAKQVLKEVLK